MYSLATRKPTFGTAERIVHFSTMDESHWKRLKQMYLGAKVNQGIFAGTQLEIGDGRAEITFTVDDRFHHAAGGMHGAIYFRMMDDTAYFAAASHITDAFLVTKEFKVDLRRPFSEGRLRCEGEILKEDESGIIAKATLYNEEGKVLSTGEGLFVRSKRSLSDIPGYADQ